MKRKKYNRYEVLEEHSIMYVNRKNEQIEVLVDNDDIEKERQIMFNTLYKEVV